MKDAIAVHSENKNLLLGNILTHGQTIIMEGSIWHWTENKYLTWGMLMQPLDQLQQY